MPPNLSLDGGSELRPCGHRHGLAVALRQKLNRAPSAKSVGDAFCRLTLPSDVSTTLVRVLSDDTSA